MRRTGFKRPEYERPPRSPVTPLAEPSKAVMRASSQEVAAVSKTEYIRSEPYRRWVVKTGCRICGAMGQNQAAHPNSLAAGGSAGGKASDLLCFALCSVEAFDHHRSFDNYEYCSKEDMRAFEIQWAAETQAELICMSQAMGREAQRLRELLRSLGLVR